MQEEYVDVMFLVKAAQSADLAKPDNGISAFDNQEEGIVNSILECPRNIQGETFSICLIHYEILNKVP